MSDTESYYQTGAASSAATTRTNQDDENHDQNLHDHRNQLTTFQSGNRYITTEESAVSDSEDTTHPIIQTEYTEGSRKYSKASSSPRGASKSATSGVMGGLRKDYYLKSDDENDDNELPSPSSSSAPLQQGILLKGNTSSNINSSSKKKAKGRKNSTMADNLESDLVSPMIKIKTNDSTFDRRMSRSSIDSEADSHASRSSQETEEDVCFPMSREHIRINGIDFDEIEEFIKEERDQQNIIRNQQLLHAQRTATRLSNARSTGTSITKPSSAALKYTPKNILKKTNTVLTKFRTRIAGNNDEIDEMDSLQSLHSDSQSRYAQNTDTDSASEQVKFGGTRITDGSAVNIDRFAYFSSESDETIHAPDIPSLVGPDQTVRKLFRNGEPTWWLDCSCPTDVEMKVLAKAFGIHPLTAEDIRMQEAREKVELFRNYYFVCFHTFEADKESEDYLEPINVYMVVFREGILTFHFSPITHPANVRRRVRQLRDYVEVTADWLCYALIDDITDSFAPVITGIEYEADAIEDSVFVAREMDFGGMLLRIGESRRKVMTLMRLLSGKADVIKMFAKRCQDEAAFVNHHQINEGGITGIRQSHNNLHGLNSPTPPNSNTPGVSFGPAPGASAANLEPINQWQFQTQGNRTQPRADIALYLGDIQDHVVTMFQNLAAYEKIFSRSHANYLAQLQVESVNSNNRVTDMLSKVTLIGTMLVPLNVITGLFGMNVTVPGEQTGKLGWFFGIVGVMFAVVIVCFYLGKIWLDRILVEETRPTANSSRRSIKSLGLRRNNGAKSIISFPNKYE
ncbi:aluminum resistance putative divalent cation transporter [Scheffersomyces amazonensis]|uniref:aluminum resistance putative divalent cation transporter n=1 Tax=Scheffersomyces amazonensis TaxID=1078765 RepID=UPI00315CD75E